MGLGGSVKKKIKKIEQLTNKPMNNLSKKTRKIGELNLEGGI